MPLDPASTDVSPWIHYAAWEAALKASPMDSDLARIPAQWEALGWSAKERDKGTRLALQASLRILRLGQEDELRAVARANAKAARESFAGAAVAAPGGMLEAPLVAD